MCLPNKCVHILIQSPKKSHPHHSHKKYNLTKVEFFWEPPDSEILILPTGQLRGKPGIEKYMDGHGDFGTWTGLVELLLAIVGKMYPPKVWHTSPQGSERIGSYFLCHHFFVSGRQTVVKLRGCMVTMHHQKPTVPLFLRVVSPTKRASNLHFSMGFLESKGQ